MSRPFDYTGQRFGRLTVECFVGHQIRYGRKLRVWQLRCDCGKTTELETSRIKQAQYCGYQCPLNPNKNRSKSLKVGDKFGSLTIVGQGYTQSGRAGWVLRCDCGNEITRTRGCFDNSHGIESCGCIKRPRTGRKPQDLTGQRFGLLTVERFIDRVLCHGKMVPAECECRCDCGNTVIYPAAKLIRKRSKTRQTYISCGDPLQHDRDQGLKYPPTPEPLPNEVLAIVAKYRYWCEPQVGARENHSLYDRRMERLHRAAWTIVCRRQSGEKISEQYAANIIRKNLRKARFDSSKMRLTKTIGGKTAMLSSDEVLPMVTVKETLGQLIDRTNVPRRPKRFRRC